MRIRSHNRAAQVHLVFASLQRSSIRCNTVGAPTEYVLWYRALTSISPLVVSVPGLEEPLRNISAEKRGKNEMQNWPDISWRNLAQLYALNSSRSPAKKVAAVGSSFVHLILETSSSYSTVYC